MRLILQLLLLSMLLAGCGLNQMNRGDEYRTGSYSSLLPLAGSDPDFTPSMSLNAASQPIAIEYRLDQPQLKIIGPSSQLLMRLPEVAYPNDAKIISHNDSTYLYIKLNYYDEYSIIQNRIDERWAFALVEFSHGRFKVIYNSMFDQVNDPKNFSFQSESDHFSISDEANNMKVKLPSNIQLRTFEGDIRKIFTPSNWFTDISFSSTSDTIDFTCIKLIPGMERNHPSGYFIYTYTLENSMLIMKEIGFYTSDGAFLENMQLVKKMSVK